MERADDELLLVTEGRVPPAAGDVRVRTGLHRADIGRRRRAGSGLVGHRASGVGATGRGREWPFAAREVGYAYDMPLGPQPPGRRGTVDQPYSALNLRLVLAGFGFVVSTAAAVWLLHVGLRVPGWLLAGWAVIALIDLVVVQLRRRARHRGGGGGDHSLFE